jgi:hypothetical protein
MGNWFSSETQPERTVYYVDDTIFHTAKYYTMDEVPEGNPESEDDVEVSKDEIKAYIRMAELQGYCPTKNYGFSILNRF